MQGGPGSRRTDGRTQPPSQQHVGPMQNGTNILAAVGQQVCSVHHNIWHLQLSVWCTFGFVALIPGLPLHHISAVVEADGTWLGVSKTAGMQVT